jgi:protein-S-isoprenylcysteine O-methyltransferase Ste14
LVTNGMFKYSRNPMYTGMILFLAGLALLLDNAYQARVRRWV